MTTTTAPAAREAARESRRVSMLKITWYQHRLAMAGLAILLIGYAAVFTISGLHLHALDAQYLHRHCATRGSATCADLETKLASLLIGKALRSLLIMPAAIGLFAGAPLVAREFDTGTSRFARTQDASFRRQLLGHMLVLGSAAALAACLIALLGSWWWRSPYPSYPLVMTDGWDTASFSTTALTLTAWTLLCFALGVLAGTVIRRTVPAMIAALIGILAALGGGGLLSRVLLHVDPLPVRSLPAIYLIGNVRMSHGVPVAVGRVNKGLLNPIGTAGPHGTWQVTGLLTGSDGQHLSARATAALIGRMPLPIAWGGSPARLRAWLASHHVTYWVGYQPASRYWLFQVAFAAILVVAAGVTGLLAVRLIGRRS